VSVVAAMNFLQPSMCANSQIYTAFGGKSKGDGNGNHN
jgi:hypothetical protein